jgi:hypothetical protein
MYRVSIKFFPDYKSRGIQTYFFLPLLKLVSKILCHVSIVTFGFWMQHFQTGGLGEMVRDPGHHDRRLSTPLDFLLWGYVKDKVFSTPVPDITDLKARITDAFGTITEDMLVNRRTGGKVKGKLANRVGSQYSSHCLRTWCIQH